MSQHINGVVAGDALIDTKGENTSFELEINKIPLHSVGGMRSTAMESVGNPSQKHGSEAEVSVKLEVYEDGGRGNSDEIGILVKKENESDIKNEGSDDLKADDACRDPVSAKDPDASLGSHMCGNNVADRFTDGSLDRECSGDSERANLYDTTFSSLPKVGRKRPVGRPKGKRSAGRASLSFEHYQSEDANSPGGVDFLSTSVGTPVLADSGRGMAMEKRKRGRPRGSRGCGRGAIPFESRMLDDVYSGASDSGDTEATGSNFSDSGLGGGVISPQPVAITKAVRGALRPGCKSYRGRASGMGRGLRMSYGDDTPSTWDVDRGVVPMEYESALSPTSRTGALGKRRLSHSEHLTPSPRPKRGHGSRGRSRGRPRGRKPRASFDHDSAVDNDSSDVGTPGFDTPVFSATDAESPDPSVRTESDAETPVAATKYRRGRGRGSRGSRGSVTPVAKVSEEKIVTCAACKESMTNTTYVYHKLRAHNGLSWREGIDEPIDIANEKVVKAVLKQTLQKRKQLTCEKCGISRSSLVGYESHITFCAKSEGERDALMENCPVCARRMMPSSLKVHMSVHRQEKKSQVTEETLDSSLDDGPFDPGEGSSTSTGKKKRAAANRAVSLMQSFIKGEDIEMEEVPKIKAPISLELSEMYSGVKEKTSDGGDDSSSKKNDKGENPTLYQVAAWMRTVQRHGKANCKNPGCSFSSTVKADLIEHYKTCELKPKINYLCKMCSFGCEEEEMMKKHIQSDHMGGSEGGDEAVENLSEFESEETGESEMDSDELLREGAVEGNYVGEKPPRKKKKIEKKPKKEQTGTEEKPKEGDGKTPKTVKYTRNVNFLAKHGLYRRSGLQGYIATLRWNLDFQLSNFSIPSLYTEWMPYAKDWIHLGEKEANTYLPKARVSPHFATMDILSELYKPKVSQKKSLPPFSHLPLFGSSIKPSAKSSQSGFITMFVGGPVWAQAWCPTPLYINCFSSSKDGHGSNKGIHPPISQFLALCCNPDFDSYHNVESQVHGEKSMIQIWDCGPINNLESTELVPPVMALGIAHDFGPVWALEWCPSGCYDLDTETDEMSESKTEPSALNEGTKPLRRLGVLAAACGDGTIRIFPVPFPSELAKDKPVHGSSEGDSPSVGISCGAQPTLGTSGSEEVVQRTEISKPEDHDSDVCVEVEERVGKNKSVSSSIGKPCTKEIPNQSAFSSSGVTHSKSGSENSRSTDKTSKTNQSLPIFKPSSVITLVVNSCSSDKSSENWQCLCLSWSLLGKSHSVLAAGFSNGLIALWDMKTSSPLLRVTKVQQDGSLGVFLRPYHMFLGHKNYVTAVVLAVCSPVDRHPSGEKYPRYLISGSRDRYVKVWDLEDTGAPLSSHPRGLVTSVACLNNWMSFICSIDDSFACGRANSKAQAIRSYGYKPSPMLNQNSPVMSVICSDWLNTFAHGTNAGEACLLAASQVLLAVESSKVIKDRRMFVFYTELVDLKGDENGKEVEHDASGSKGETDGAVKASEDSGDSAPPKEDPGKCSESVINGSEDKSHKNQTEKAKVVKKKAKKMRKKEDGEMESDDETVVDPDVEFKESPRTYTEATDRYGLLFCDCGVDQEFGKLPKEAMWILQQSERMKTIPCDLYPISAINRMSWNPNLQSCIWLASGHQSGLVRLCRVQKTRNKIVEMFEGNAQKKIRQVFMQRKGCDS